ncbi:hypothetical protein GCM10009804_56520 [Kribbella hippodromi]|uniref:Uncharacterized protein n=1 Tax=Kribbella hippodromi TaxID=434347 RepID=A0ABP4PZF2_9ACTN
MAYAPRSRTALLEARVVYAHTTYATRSPAARHEPPFIYIGAPAATATNPRVRLHRRPKRPRSRAAPPRTRFVRGEPGKRSRCRAAPNPRVVCADDVSEP